MKNLTTRVKAQNKSSIDYILLSVVLILLLAGSVIVYSASYYYSYINFGNQFQLFFSHVKWITVGIAILLIVSRIDYKIYKKHFGILLPITILFLCLVFVPSLSTELLGSKRWISIAGDTLMPSEIAKVTFTIFLAGSLSYNYKKLNKFLNGILPYVIITAIVAGLILLQPDFSTASLFFALALTMIYLAGANLKYILFPIIAAILGGGFFIMSEPYRLQRFTAFLRPFDDPTGSGYQIIQSFYALGSGGVFGVGIGNSVQNKLYLPEPANDFIFSTIGEELGFIGSITFIFLYIIIIYRCYNIAKNAPDKFSFLLVSGTITLLVLQVFINIGVTVGLLPVTGIPLMFVSKGGNAIVFSLILFGIVLNISKNINRPG